MLIAIDGPSGSGKSSTSKEVAKRLGLAYLDTGAMYRAITSQQLAAGIPGDDQQAIIELASKADLDIGTDPNNPTVTINQITVTEELHSPEISAAVSQAAVISEVREILTAKMRAEIIAANRNIVVEGRDITTVVAPDADVRVLLVVDAAVRKQRRLNQLAGKLTVEELNDQVDRRDQDDSKVSEFFTAADGVVKIDSTNLTLNQVVELICELAAKV